MRAHRAHYTRAATVSWRLSPSPSRDVIPPQPWGQQSVLAPRALSHGRGGEASRSPRPRAPRRRARRRGGAGTQPLGAVVRPTFLGPALRLLPLPLQPRPRLLAHLDIEGQLQRVHARAQDGRRERPQRLALQHALRRRTRGIDASARPVACRSCSVSLWSACRSSAQPPGAYSACFLIRTSTRLEGVRTSDGPCYPGRPSRAGAPRVS